MIIEVELLKNETKEDLSKILITLGDDSDDVGMTIEPIRTRNDGLGDFVGYEVKQFGDNRAHYGLLDDILALVEPRNVWIF